jgi:anthranilate synthase/indole-3-glycerol phosphate synthase/phosphoribosylanthranilate isomerase
MSKMPRKMSAFCGSGIRSRAPPNHLNSDNPARLRQPLAFGEHDNEMAILDLIDHSPHQPQPAPQLANASNVVLIDNFDSFSWNIYQYLVLEGASVTVFRNDEITVEELVELRPTQLVISPGPGHPQTDSGMSRDAIKHFAGKIPILGVCMGQ